MAHRPRISDRLYSEAERVKEEYDLSGVGDALRHMAREGGYDV
jgi:hypothetical protein